MKIGTLGFVIFVGALMLLASIAVADFANTRVFFIIKRTIGFTVTLPGQSAVSGGNTTNAYLGGSAAVYTADIEFNTTNKSQAFINASVAPCCANDQDATTAIFVYTNTGTIPINITLSFNGTTMPAGVNVTASNETQGGALGDLLATGGLGCGRGTGAGLTAAPDGGNADIDLRCKNVTNTFTVFVADIPPSLARNLFVWAFFDNFPATGGSVGTAGYTRNLTHASQATDGT